MALLEVTNLLNVLDAQRTHLPLQVFDLGPQLLDLSDQACLVFLVQFGRLLLLLGDLCDALVEVLAGGLAVPEQFLVLRHILLQIVEHLQFLIERDQRVELVLQLNLLLLQCKLQLRFVPLVEVARRIVLNRRCRRRDRDVGVVAGNAWSDLALAILV